MSSNLSGTITIVPAFTNRDTDAGLSNPKETVTQSSAVTFANGIGATEIDSLFTDEKTDLAASTTESYDLTSLEDGIGNAVAFVKVKTLSITAKTANTSDILLDSTIVNAFLGYATVATKIAIQPGGNVTFVAPGDGYTVTAATADILAIENTDGSVTAAYDLIITGTSA